MTTEDKEKEAGGNFLGGEEESDWEQEKRLQGERIDKYLQYATERAAADPKQVAMLIKFWLN